VPDTYTDYNKVVGSFESERDKVENSTNNLKEFSGKNGKIQEDIKTVSCFSFRIYSLFDYSCFNLLKSEKNIENIGKIMNEVQQSINDLKNSVDLDSQDKAANIQAKQESLKSKVKESGVTLERTKVVSIFF
jgi:hypothetical protein